MLSLPSSSLPSDSDSDSDSDSNSNSNSNNYNILEVLILHLHRISTLCVIPRPSKYCSRKCLESFSSLIQCHRGIVRSFPNPCTSHPTPKHSSVCSKWASQAEQSGCKIYRSWEEKSSGGRNELPVDGERRKETRREDHQVWPLPLGTQAAVPRIWHGAVYITSS